MSALNKKSVKDIDVSGKRVLVRCDFNVPLQDGKITSDKRIVASLPTIKYLIDHHAKVILCSHLGRPKGEYKEEFSFYLKTLLREIQNKGEYFETVCQNLLEALVLTLVRRTKKQLSFTPTKKITKECRFVEQYIDEHFMEDITLQTLSDLTYLNKYYLVHAFKNYKGVSPINYLINRRLVEAKHLLATTNYPISKIAASIGFSSQSYFSQVFRKETGMSPNAYRQNEELQKDTGQS